MMTKNLSLFLLFLCTVCSCRQVDTRVNPEFIKLNVNNTYPVKEIYLDDLAEIEFILPEIHDDFIYRGIPRFVNDDYMIIYERQAGEIMVFDRKGKPFHKFSRHGNGPEEYTYVFGILYDSGTDDLYVSSSEKIQVYSIKGDFKRTLQLREGFISTLTIFDDKHFLCHDNYKYYPAPFFLLSRENGEITDEIEIRYETKLEMFSRRQEGDMIYTYSGPGTNIAKVKDGFILTDHSIDTVYLYTYDKQLIPVLERTPPIATQKPYIYLNSYQESPSWLFMNKVSTEFDWDTKQGFFQTNLMLDKNDGKIYEQKILLREYKGKEVSLSPGLSDFVYGTMNGMLHFSSGELLEALDEGKLNGRLKEVASQMDEESNMLLLLYQFK